MTENNNEVRTWYVRECNQQYKEKLSSLLVTEKMPYVYDMNLGGDWHHSNQTGIEDVGVRTWGTWTLHAMGSSQGA